MLHMGVSISGRTPSYHPFLVGISPNKNHPAMGVSPFMGTSIFFPTQDSFPVEELDDCENLGRN